MCVNKTVPKNSYYQDEFIANTTHPKQDSFFDVIYTSFSIFHSGYTLYVTTKSICRLPLLLASSFSSSQCVLWDKECKCLSRIEIEKKMSVVSFVEV